MNHPLEDESSDWKGVDRRDSDRRERPTRPWIGMRGPLRRIEGRRDVDQMGYVDRYSRHEVALILTVFLLNVCDAFFTMLWLDRGGREANPVMDFFLDIGTGAFLAQKCLVVGIWLVVLLVHKNFRFARIGLYASLCVYAVLMVTHFGIIALGIKPVKMHGNLPLPRIHEAVVLEQDEPALIRPFDVSRRAAPPTAE